VLRHASIAQGSFLICSIKTLICHLIQMAASWLISFKNHPRYYTKNPRPKASDIRHLPRWWAVLPIPRFFSSRDRIPNRLRAASRQVWAAV
jgi:hypothetical protein